MRGPVGRWIVGVAALGALAGVGLLSEGPAASSFGISMHSGNPEINSGLDCNICHSGGIVPVVTLDGPTTVDPGVQNAYTLVIAGGQRAAGGLDVSATGGTLVASDGGTQLLDDEITHAFPRAADGNREVVFTFDWLAPATPGSYTLYAAGNSVNGAQGSNGDAAATVSLQIDVSAPPATPGETSGETLAKQLVVTAFDRATGQMTIEYGNPCGATDNAIYFGPLAQVATHGWSGDVCGIGTSESYAGFDPGAGSFFFVVVAGNGSDEGSYGLERDAVGATVERPPFLANVCGTTQSLADRCDLP